MSEALSNEVRADIITGAATASYGQRPDAAEYVHAIAMKMLGQATARLTRELEEAKAEIVARDADMATAASAFSVPCPEPGTDMARLLIANRLLRRELEEARKCCRWEAGNQRRALEYWDGEYGTTLAEEFPFGCDTIEHVAEALIVARRELEEAREALREYGEHKRDCQSRGFYATPRRPPCSCGFATALAATPPQEASEPKPERPPKSHPGCVAHRCGYGPCSGAGRGWPCYIDIGAERTRTP